MPPAIFLTTPPTPQRCHDASFSFGQPPRCLLRAENLRHATPPSRYCRDGATPLLHHFAPARRLFLRPTVYVEPPPIFSRSTMFASIARRHSVQILFRYADVLLIMKARRNRPPFFAASRSMMSSLFAAAARHVVFAERHAIAGAISMSPRRPRTPAVSFPLSPTARKKTIRMPECRHTPICRHCYSAFVAQRYAASKRFLLTTCARSSARPARENHPSR